MQELIDKLQGLWRSHLMSNYVSGSGVPMPKLDYDAYVRINDKLFRLKDAYPFSFGVVLTTDAPKSYDELEEEFAQKGL